MLSMIMPTTIRASPMITWRRRGGSGEQSMENNNDVDNIN